MVAARRCLWITASVEVALNFVMGMVMGFLSRGRRRAGHALASACAARASAVGVCPSGDPECVLVGGRSASGAGAVDVDRT